MEHGIKIELVDTGEVLYLTQNQGVLLQSYVLSSPEPKRYTVDIDGRDGDIDFTGLFGTTKFKNRTATATLNIAKIGNLTEQSEYHNSLMIKLHGQLVNITHWQRPYCYFQGSCKIGNIKNGVFSLVVDADPYGYKNTVTAYSYNFATTKNLVEAINIDYADADKRWTRVNTSDEYQIVKNNVYIAKKSGSTIYSPRFSVAGSNKLSFSCKTSAESLRVLLRKYNASGTLTQEYITLSNGKYDGWTVPTGIFSLEVAISPKSTDVYPVSVSKFQVETGSSCTDYVPKDGVLLVNSGKAVIPTITVTAETTITIGAITTTLSAGTYRFSDLTIPSGDIILTPSGSGRITITYQERLL